MTSRTAPDGCMPKSVTDQVAPARAHGSGSSPGGRSTTTSNGSSAGRAWRISPTSSASASGPGSPIGYRPSHRSARRTGRRLRPLPRHPDRDPGLLHRDRLELPGPVPGQSSRPWSSSRARSRGSSTSPNGPNSPFRALPRPTPKMRRPALSRSKVTVSLASLGTRLRDTGVTIGPIRTRLVADATAASATHGRPPPAPAPGTRRGPRRRNRPSPVPRPRPPDRRAPGVGELVERRHIDRMLHPRESSAGPLKPIDRGCRLRGRMAPMATYVVGTGDRGELRRGEPGDVLARRCSTRAWTCWRHSRATGPRSSSPSAPDEWRCR